MIKKYRYFVEYWGDSYATDQLITSELFDTRLGADAAMKAFSSKNPKGNYYGIERVYQDINGDTWVKEV